MASGQVISAPVTLPLRELTGLSGRYIAALEDLIKVYSRTFYTVKGDTADDQIFVPDPTRTSHLPFEDEPDRLVCGGTVNDHQTPGLPFGSPKTIGCTRPCTIPCASDFTRKRSVRTLTEPKPGVWQRKLKRTRSRC